MEQIRFSVDRCVMCGVEVEEGRWVCTGCEQRVAATPKQAAVRGLPRRDTPSKLRRFFRKIIEK